MTGLFWGESVRAGFPSVTPKQFRNYSAQLLHRQKSLIFALIYQWFIGIQRFGAGEGIRTLDPNLGKVVLYP
ncbi:MAG: hypothetical protein U1D66_07010, partial [Erythrobacter sp.]|nr:hypothetical protein [Erythrobacter sp.]